MPTPAQRRKCANQSHGIHGNKRQLFTSKELSIHSREHNVFSHSLKPNHTGQAVDEGHIEIQTGDAHHHSTVLKVEKKKKKEKEEKDKAGKEHTTCLGIQCNFLIINASFISSV
jgi:hypothetical protein